MDLLKRSYWGKRASDEILRRWLCKIVVQVTCFHAELLQRRILVAGF